MRVTNKFSRLYSLFNVINIADEISTLRRSERLLLLATAISNMSEDNPFVIENSKPFKDDLILIYESQDGKTVTDRDLLSIMVDPKKNIIVGSSNLYSSKGVKISKALSENDAWAERREIILNKIIKKDEVKPIYGKKKSPKVDFNTSSTPV